MDKSTPRARSAEVIRRYRKLMEDATVDTVREATKLGTQTIVVRHIRRFYICARYGRKEEALSYAEALERAGGIVTSTWIRQVEDEMGGNEQGEASLLAQKDYEEIQACDVLLYLSEEENNTWGRGGRHVEFGYAAALGKWLFVIGPQENLFHYHPSVTHFSSFDDFMTFMCEGGR